MSFEKGDRVVLRDEHSEYDGETGTIEQVSETMFGDETFVISFEEGQEAGISEDAIETAEGETSEAPREDAVDEE